MAGQKFLVGKRWVDIEEKRMLVQKSKDQRRLKELQMLDSRTDEQEEELALLEDEHGAEVKEIDKKKKEAEKLAKKKLDADEKKEAALLADKKKGGEPKDKKPKDTTDVSATITEIAACESLEDLEKFDTEDEAIKLAVDNRKVELEVALANNDSGEEEDKKPVNEEEQKERTEYDELTAKVAQGLDITAAEQIRYDELKVKYAPKDEDTEALA